MRHLTPALLLVALLVAGCARISGSGQGSPSPTPSPEPSSPEPTPAGIEHPTGSDELVLRIEYRGGFVPESYHLTRLPILSLYGDGRLVLEGPQIEIYPGPALPNLLVRDLTEEGIQSILAAALDAGLSGKDRYLRHDGIADAADTVFTVVAGGGRHETSVYALGYDEGVSEDDAKARRTLSRFLDDMTNLDPWLPEGSVGAERPFESEAIRFFVTEGRPFTDEGVEQQPVDWPLAQPLASFLPKDNSTYGCGSAAGDDADKLRATASQASELSPWRSEGKIFGVVFRPLLPDEQGCEGLGF